MTADYVTLQSASDGTAAAVLDALRATDRALRGHPCGHDEHPYEGDLDEQLPRLVSYLPLLEHGAAQADRGDRHCAEVWRCPRNVAGYARVAVDILAPGTTDGIPARLSTAEQEEAADLASILDGHPAPGVSVSWSLSHYGKSLAEATEPAERAGLVVIVAALSRYAAGLVDCPGPLNDLIAGLASVPAAPAEGGCGHDEAAHPVLPDAPEDVITAGMRLKSPSGRRLLAERSGRPGEGAPLEAWLCPAFVAGLARAARQRVRTAREELLGALGAAR
ncbi:hypothetical protein [Streptomyces sp. NPDC058989]|uniref:hypothetical protein n=1 Tax=Streptomyces sp. NPDC058989 TaxID=3346686 RepID=UPI0036BE6EC8